MPVTAKLFERCFRGTPTGDGDDVTAAYDKALLLANDLAQASAGAIAHDGIAYFAGGDESELKLRQGGIPKDGHDYVAAWETGSFATNAREISRGL